MSDTKATVFCVAKRPDGCSVKRYQNPKFYAPPTDYLKGHFLHDMSSVKVIILVALKFSTMTPLFLLFNLQLKSKTVLNTLKFQRITSVSHEDHSVMK